MATLNAGPDTPIASPINIAILPTPLQPERVHSFLLHYLIAYQKLANSQLLISLLL